MNHKIDNSIIQFSSIASSDGHSISDDTESECRVSYEHFEVVYNLDLKAATKIMAELNRLIKLKFS